MRIASDMIYKQLSRSLKDNLSKLNDINTQLSSGKKINMPSDDILGTLKAMDYKLSISQNKQYEQNITDSTNYLSYVDTVLTQTSETLLSLTKQTSDSSGTAEDRAYYATQATALRDTLLDLSNSVYLNSYIFSGSQSDQQAYAYDVVSNKYVYQGDDQQISVSIGTGMTSMTINVVGNSDNSAILTPFSYALQAAATTTLSDGSVATYTPVLDPIHNSTIIQVGITNAANPGENDTFSFSNVMDMANLMSHAWQYQDVDVTKSLTAQQSMNRIEVVAGALDKTQNQLLTVQGQVGLRQAQLSDQKSKLDANTLTQQNSLSQTEDADMNETIIDLQMVATTLNALRSAAANIISKSLFDFLK